MPVISAKLIEDTARELTARAAIDIPPDYRDGVRLARDRETGRLARFVLTEMLANWDLATADRRPMCADTGLPRYYVKLGNEAVVIQDLQEFRFFEGGDRLPRLVVIDENDLEARRVEKIALAGNAGV